MAFNFEKVRENIARAASEPEGFLKHPNRKEFEQIAKDALERCSYKSGWQQCYQDRLLRYRSLDRLTNILTLADGDVEGWRVIDLGCGSPDEGWLPYKAEALNDLGAKVVGVDYRLNPSASYEHRVVDFGDFCDHHHYGDCFNPKSNPKIYQSHNEDKKKLAKERLEGGFDLVIATSLLNDGLTNDDFGFDTIYHLLGICAKPQQVQYFDSFRRAPYKFYISGLRRGGIEILYDGGDSIGIKE